MLTSTHTFQTLARTVLRRDVRQVQRACTQGAVDVDVNTHVSGTCEDGPLKGRQTSTACVILVRTVL